MLQTNPISGPPPAPADPAPPEPARPIRTAALRTEDGIAPSPKGPRGLLARATSNARESRALATSTPRAAGYATTSSKASSKDDFSFLRDPKLTLEQKLMRFMTMMAKKLDEDIQRRMEELAPKDAAKKSSSSKSSSSKSSSSKKKGGIFGKALSTLLKAKPIKDFLKQVTGPVLAAGASALGFPALAPVLLKAGPAIGRVLGTWVGSLDVGGSASTSASSGGSEVSSSSASSSGSSAASSASSTSGSSGLSASEERIKMMELQQVLEKQKEMFTLVSNMLRTFHDMRMASINNIR